jgi:uncharacterized protein YabN with tetrapyrrole methylase and pyrophosphatase domain
MADDSTVQAFAKLLSVVTELRERCAWDREQKLADTPRHLIEEAYEVADAIARGNLPDISEELGDLTVQCLFVALILGEQSQFDIASGLRSASEKLVRRHPHVYGDTRAETTAEVLENWDRTKLQERERKNPDGAKSLAHVGRGLPASMRAEKLGEKARRAGMDWANIREVPRFIGKDAEQTLRAACDKFVARFDEVARIAAARGLDLKSMTPSEIDALWNEAKAAARR